MQAIYVSEKLDILRKHFEISKSYYFVWYYLIVMEFHKNVIGQENDFTRRLTINEKEPVSTY